MPRQHHVSRGQCAIQWIEEYCIVPAGPRKGDRVLLTPEQRATVHWCYDSPYGVRHASDIGQPLAAYLVLLHVAGIEHDAAMPELQTDIFRVICPQLGTGWPSAA
jgi:hypothetical protein